MTSTWARWNTQKQNTQTGCKDCFHIVSTRGSRLLNKTMFCFFFFLNTFKELAQMYERFKTSTNFVVKAIKIRVMGETKKIVKKTHMNWLIRKDSEIGRHELRLQEMAKERLGGKAKKLPDGRTAWAEDESRSLFPKCYFKFPLLRSWQWLPIIPEYN